MNKFKRVIKIAVIIILLLGIIRGGLYLKNDFGYDTRNTIFISPSGQTEVLLRYDFLSKPFVFYENKQVFAYTGNAFMESVYFDVEWISEKEIRLYTERYNEEYFIDLE